MDERLETFLAAHQAKYRVVPLRGAVTSQERAAQTHTSGWSWAKVVVVKERDGFVMAIVPGCCVVELDRLKGLIGHGEIRLATVEEVYRVVPHYAPGAIPPFGELVGLRSFVDRALFRAREVTMPGGDLGTGIRMRAAEFRRLVDGSVGDFAVLETLLAPGAPPRASAGRR